MSTRVVGGPATGSSFFDREKIVERICGRLKNNSILLVAPRRFGKTSIMLKAQEELESHGILALYLDLEWVSEPLDFVTEVLYRLKADRTKHFDRLVENFPKGILGAIKKIQSVEIGGFRVKMRKELESNWIENGREIFRCLRALDIMTVLFVDEFPLMIHNMISHEKLQPAEIRDFLYWLRALRVETGIRMVLGGSIGIDYILKDLDASASINDMERVLVGPFDKETAEKFIASLFASEKIEIDVKSIKKILDVLEEPIPYFIQVIISALLSQVRASKTPVSSKLVEQVYAQRVLGIECKGYFEHFFQRLSIYYTTSDADIARKLLTDLAAHSKVTKKELFKTYSLITKGGDVERFNQLLNDLENDFYLRVDDKTGECRFGTKVLKDLWLRRYGVLR